MKRDIVKDVTASKNNDKQAFGFQELDVILDLHVACKLPEDVYIYCHTTKEYNEKIAFMKPLGPSMMAFTHLSQNELGCFPCTTIYRGRFRIHFIDLEKKS